MKRLFVSGRRYRGVLAAIDEAHVSLIEENTALKVKNVALDVDNQRLLADNETLRAERDARPDADALKAAAQKHNEHAVALEAVIQQLREAAVGYVGRIDTLEREAATRVKALESQERELEELRQETVRLAGERDSALATVSRLSVASNGWTPSGVAS